MLMCEHVLQKSHDHDINTTGRLCLNMQLLTIPYLETTSCSGNEVRCPTSDKCHIKFDFLLERV